jgi:hypothetical protein
MSTTKNLTIDQGSVFYANLQYVDSSKNPISLSGYTLASQIRKSYYSANAASFTTTVIDAANGKLQLSFTSTQTGLIKPGRYVYDVEATLGSSTVRIFEGDVTITPGVTGNTYGTIFVSTEAIRGLTGNTGPSSNSLVSGNIIISLDRTGNLILSNNSRINTSYGGLDLIANPGGFVEMVDSKGNTYIYVQDELAGIATKKSNGNFNIWEFTKTGNLNLPSGGYIGDAYGAPTSPWFVPPASTPGGLASNDRRQYIQIGDGTGIYIGTSYPSPGYEWEFRRDGIIKFPNNSTQSGGALPLANLKTIVASSPTWAAFQANIAAL